MVFSDEKSQINIGNNFSRLIDLENLKEKKEHEGGIGIWNQNLKKIPNVGTHHYKM